MVCSSVSVLKDIISAFNICAKRLLRAGPATVTSDARARALNVVIGVCIRVGMSTGKTTLARTAIISFRASKAYTDSSPDCKELRSVGKISSIALSPTFC
jgi:hypothetical protein